MWDLFGKKLEVNKQVYLKEQSDYKEALNKTTSKAISSLNEELEKAKKVLKELSANQAEVI